TPLDRGPRPPRRRADLGAGPRRRSVRTLPPGPPRLAAVGLAAGRTGRRRGPARTAPARARRAGAAGPRPRPRELVGPRPPRRARRGPPHRRRRAPARPGRRPPDRVPPRGGG